MRRAWRARLVAFTALVIAAALSLTRQGRGHAMGRRVPGGMLMAHAAAYDRHSRALLGSLFRGIAANVAAVTAPTAKVLEVGCGPGQLAIRLAQDHDLDVTGVDLDPEMIGRARVNAERSTRGRRQPRFIEGEAASLPFDDASFDVVVSTFSMHHWSDPHAGVREIARVLRPGGRALIWDLGPGALPFHDDVPDAAGQVHRGPLRVVSVQPWRWPWRLSLSQRLELVR